MNIHESTLQIVYGFISSFYDKNQTLPLIGDILDALNHPEMSVYLTYFKRLTEPYSRDHLIMNTSGGSLEILEIEVISNTPAR
jgi:hypothetical protein